MALLWQKRGPHMILQIGYSWILINVPKDIPCQISHCWVYPIALFHRNDQNMALYGQNMVLTGNMALLWPTHGPHNVHQIFSSWFLIIVPRDVPCQISHCWVYPVAPFPRNGQNIGLLWTNHGHHMALQIGSSWIIVNVTRDAPC